MSGTIPLIPPPLGTNAGNPSTSSPNRVENVPVDTTNTTTITNVAQNVDENIPQLLDSRGGSHVTNVPELGKEDFTSWNVRFLVFLDGLEPYLLKTLEDGPFVPMSSLSTFDNPLPKRHNQWSHVSVIKCKTTKAIWNDLILGYEGPSDTRDTMIAALQLKFNAFKELEGEKVNGTFTRLKCLLNDLENNGVIISQAEFNATFVNSLPRKWLSVNQAQRANNSIKNDKTQRSTIQASNSKALISSSQFQDSDSHVEEDLRSSSEFIADLNAEYHERALLENQKRFYKRSGRVGTTRKPTDKSKETHFTCESVSSKDEGTTKTKAFIAITEEEPSVGKGDARSGQWIEITMRKALGGRGKRKEKISSKEVIFTKADESSFVLVICAKVFSIWMTFRGRTLDLSSFREETDKITSQHEEFKNCVYNAWRRYGYSSVVLNHGLSIWTLIEIFLKHLDSLSCHIINLTAEEDLRKFSDMGAWYAIDDCAQYDKKSSNPTSVISDETIANPNAQIVGDDMARVHVPRCMAWLDYDEHVDSLSTMDNEVGVTSPEITTQTLPLFEEYTPLVTYPEEVEKTLGTPIEVEPLNETKQEEVGLNYDHNTPINYREVPSFDGPEPQPLLNNTSLDVSLGDIIGLEPPIKPHSHDSSRMKVVDCLASQTPPSPHVENSHYKGVYSHYNPGIDDPKRHYGFKPGLLGKSVSLGVDFLNLEMIEDDLELGSKEVSFLGRGLNSPVRPREVEKVIFDKKKHGSSYEVSLRILGGRFN
ncbi:hypothetical protein Tco_0173413 [Tanacetum coccineum]